MQTGLSHFLSQSDQCNIIVHCYLLILIFKVFAKEDFTIFAFTLTEDEMQTLSDLNSQRQSKYNLAD